jgi:hypothetical protein
MQIGELALKLDQRMIGARDISGATSTVPMQVAASIMAPTTFGCWLMPR